MDDHTFKKRMADFVGDPESTPDRRLLDDFSIGLGAQRGPMLGFNVSQVEGPPDPMMSRLPPQGGSVQAASGQPP